jgi:hypothetical protein
MHFTKALREPVIRGEITCSVRIWQRPHVKTGGRYPLGDGAIEVTSIREITLKQITPQLAQRSGFASVTDLLKIAKHGSGENVYLVEFVYQANDWVQSLPLKAKAKARKATTPKRSPARRAKR